LTSTEYLILRLSYEILDNVFENNNVNSIYNSFLNTYWRMFYSSFPLRQIISKTNSNAWITTGIRTSCKLKRDLYLLCKNSYNSRLKNLYKLYCKILSNAKKRHCNKQIENLKNKMKTVWDITRTVTVVKTKNEVTNQLNINGDINYNFHTIPDFLNTYFLSITGKNHSAINKNNNSVDYLHQNFNKQFQNI